MAPMPWDPFRDLVAIRNRTAARIGPGSSWMPPVDVYETAGEYVVTAELPGFSAADFTISATPDTLTLSGRRPAPDVANPQYLRVERGQGDFSRTFNFPESIDVSAISADFHDGLVKITVPKAGVPGARKIDIG
jgi:HSP20 family protein